MKVRGKEPRRDKNTPIKNKKGPIGVSYQKHKKLKEGAVNRRTGGLKLKVKELRVFAGKHAKLELFDEDENHKPVLSSRQVYATSTDIAGNTEPRKSTSSSKATSSGSNNQATAKRLEFLPSRSKKKINPKSTAVDRNKCNICGVLFNSRMDKKLKSPWLGCDARRCQFWIHVSCCGFPTAEDDIFEKHIKTKLKK